MNESQKHEVREWRQELEAGKEYYCEDCMEELVDVEELI